MKIEIWCTGKTNDRFIKEGIGTYASRLEHYCRFSWRELELKKKKGMEVEAVKKAEAEMILDKLNPADFLVLLDENGTAYDSTGFSDQLQKWLNMGMKRTVFLIGGAWGFDEALLRRSQAKLSLSPMTFSHQIVRLIFLEQLYRAFTILRGEPYHNE